MGPSDCSISTGLPTKRAAVAHPERSHNPWCEPMQERVVREIRMLRAMWRELETGLRRLLHGHEGGNPGHSQGAAYGLPRQFPTLPGTPEPADATGIRGSPRATCRGSHRTSSSRTDFATT